MQVAFGVFGGSFDPPHVAHALLVHYAMTAHGLERALVVPTYSHAFGKRLASFEHRLRMCELAFHGLCGVEISDIERSLPAPNYTLNTLRALAERYPSVQLRLLIGSDVLPETNAWHDFANVAALAPPIVIERQGGPTYDPSQPALPAVSSTDIRQHIAAGQSTQGRLAAQVRSYIDANRLYTGRT